MNKMMMQKHEMAETPQFEKAEEKAAKPLDKVKGVLLAPKKKKKS